MSDYEVSDKLKLVSALYVEDDENIRESLSKTLRRKLKHLYIAKDGKEGLSLFLEHRPSLVITDISMPVMNGLEMSELIKEHDKDVQIIITTAYDDVSYLLRAIEIGVNQYVFKPISIQKLFKAIGKCIEMVFLEEKIRRQNTLIQNVLNFQSNMVIVTDGHELTRCNESFLNCLGVKNLNEFYKAHDSIGELFVKESGFIFNVENSNWLDFLLNRRDKKYKVKMYNNQRSENLIYLLKVNPLPESDNQYIISFTDITQLEWERKDLELQSITDPLTQIYNRLKFDNALEKELSRVRRYGVDLSLIMFDIDYFKKLNDTFGHLTGDAVLIGITQLVSQKIRALDVFARWGGEEFMVLLPETNLKGAIKMAEKLRGIIEEETFEKTGKVTCSFGVTCYKEDESFDSFTGRVDTAMYQAKEEGRNRVITIQPDEKSG